MMTANMASDETKNIPKKVEEDEEDEEDEASEFTANVLHVLAQVDDAENMSDEMWARELSARDATQLMSPVMVALTLLPLAFLLLMVSLIFKIIALATIYVPILIINAMVLLVLRGLVTLKDHRVRNIGCVICFSIVYSLFIASFVPLLDAWMRGVYRHGGNGQHAPTETSQDLSASNNPAGNVGTAAADANYAVYTGVGTAGLFLSGFAPLLDNYIMDDIILLLATVTVSFSALCCSQCYAIRLDDSRPPFINFQ